MRKMSCVLHAKCQGDEIERLLLAHKNFSSLYHLHRFTNYTRQDIPDRILEDCSLFLYQYLGPEWGELGSDRLVNKLPKSVPALRIPNMFFKSCWPFWTNASPMDFGDSLLDRLIDEGAPKPAILKIYLHKDIRDFVDLDAVSAESFARERAKEMETCVKTVDFVAERWKKQAMFHTVNHPGKELLAHVANGILDTLGLPPLTDDEIASLGRSFPSYSDFDLPVHPGVASSLGLAYIRPDHLFRIFGRKMTFARYISRYIDCRMNGLEKNFLAYLQLV